MRKRSLGFVECAPRNHLHNIPNSQSLYLLYFAQFSHILKTFAQKSTQKPPPTHTHTLLSYTLALCKKYGVYIVCNPKRLLHTVSLDFHMLSSFLEKETKQLERLEGKGGTLSK